jgi:3-oxoacyl-[acyl-carrier-protein] synthase II
MLGAAGSVEALICCLSVARDAVPPSLHLQRLEPDMEGLNYVRGAKGLYRPVRAALSNSFGFGGTNATLIFAKYNDS